MTGGLTGIGCSGREGGGKSGALGGAGTRCKPFADEAPAAYHHRMTQTPSDPPGAAPGKTLSPAARRALAEAAERRARAADPAVEEHGGPTGPEPTRYGDWEKKGLAVDF